VVVISAKLLAAGAVATAATSVVAALIVGVAVTVGAALSYAVGAVIAVLALALPQAGLTAARRVRGWGILVIALLGYGVAIVGMLVGLAWISRHDGLAILWVGVGVVLGGLSFVTGMVIAYPRLRISIFDDPGADT
jgi:hypothetical protein